MTIGHIVIGLSLLIHSFLNPRFEYTYIGNVFLNRKENGL